MPKQRRTKSKLERQGVNAIEASVLEIGHIWREQTIEDVGIDGHVELCVEEFPTGKILGFQIKAGTSYLKGENERQFTFYPDQDDIEYWSNLIIPLVLVVYDPRTNLCYWHDITNDIEARGENIFETRKIIISKENTLTRNFNDYALSIFDLRIMSEKEFDDVLAALVTLNWSVEEYGIKISGLDLFIEGLWGLCTKLLFHLSLVTDVFKSKLSANKRPSTIRLRLDRDSLQPFVIGYLQILKKFRLAKFDADDVNYTLYQKMEWPTFIAVLTPSGRKFINYLRKKYANERDVRDQQFFNLTYSPHVFVEVLTWFDEANHKFGPIVRSLLIQFNRYLNGYVLLDFLLQDNRIAVHNSQHISFEEIRYYIKRELGSLDKNLFILRHQDELISPLSCWLEDFIDNSMPLPIEDIELVAPSHERSLAIELLTVMSPGSITFEVFGESSPDIIQLWLRAYADNTPASSEPDAKS
jgi:hypothetical protein